MRSERERRALIAILDHATLARSWVGDLNATAFAEDRKTFYAVTRCLEIISEAARRLSPETHARHPNLMWRQMMDAGNVYRHDYDNVVEDFVWRTARDRTANIITMAKSELEND